jgi:hypothetical protein
MLYAVTRDDDNARTSQMRRRKKPVAKPRKPVLSLRAHEEMPLDILREAARRKVRVSEELRRRLEFYAAHKRAFDAPAA